MSISQKIQRQLGFSSWKEIQSLELISCWRQENERSNWLELPMSKVQVSRAVSVVIFIVTAQKSWPALPVWELIYSLSCELSQAETLWWLYATPSFFPECSCVLGFICLGWTNLWAGSLYSISCSPTPEARLGKGSRTATDAFLEFLV